MSQCGCDEKIRSKDVQNKWEWGGCSDDIHYGAEFTKKFIDSVEDPGTAEGMVNLHNNEVGRRVIITQGAAILLWVHSFVVKRQLNQIEKQSAYFMGH